MTLPVISDGDNAFLKVDTRTPPHELQPGVCAEAVNKRFEEGEAWPRLNVECQSWGLVYGNNNAVPVGAVYVPTPPLGVRRYEVSGLVAGQSYHYIPGANELQLALLQPDGSGSIITAEGDFIAPGAGGAVSLRGQGAPAGLDVTAKIVPAQQTPVAFARFNDPQGYDNLVLCSDEWRSGPGEDGGRGRAWRVLSGNLPQEIPLNGHDVWGESRLVACHNAVVLLRHGLERHYFSAAAVDTTGATIQLNATPGWVDGEKVFYYGIGGAGESSIGGPSAGLNQGTEYWVKNLPANKVELYNALDVTNPANKVDFSGGTAVGRFYLERRSQTPGIFGNGAPPLIMQGDETGATPFEVGFLAVPTKLFITAVTAIDGVDKIISVPNHRLLPGDSVVYVDVDGDPGPPVAALRTPYFAYPLNDHELTLHDNSLPREEAMLGLNPVDLTGIVTDGDYLERQGASAMPMPNGREGCYLSHSRLAIANGRNNIPVSDALDPLHFTPLARSVTANLGESDEITSLVELDKDLLVVGKENVILALNNLSNPDATKWQLVDITREYGFIAPLASVVVGKDVWGWSRKGVVSVQRTVQGEAQGVAIPQSLEMKKYVDLVDWGYATQACAATWNNRFFIAVPLKGQALRYDQDGEPYVVNNGVLVYNLRTAGWEGLWQGGALEVYCFARHKVFGEERLCFVNYAGAVCYLGDGVLDTGQVDIADRLVTRTYTGQQPGTKVWLRGLVTNATQRPKLNVSARAPGHNEQEPLLEDQEYDRTKYLNWGQPDYVPDGEGDFDKPGREDYSASPEELFIADPDAHQNVPEAVRMRIRDWGVALIVENSQGSARLQNTVVQGIRPGTSLQTASRTN